MNQREAAETKSSVGDSLCDGSALINRATEAIIAAVTTAVTAKRISLLRLCLPVRCEITGGISNAMTIPGNNQRGPTVRVAGNAKYSPPTARIAISAGHRGSGSQRSGACVCSRIRITPSIRRLTRIVKALRHFKVQRRRRFCAHKESKVECNRRAQSTLNVGRQTLMSKSHLSLLETPFGQHHCQ